MEVQQIRAGEYYGLILFGAVGMCLMSSAVELVLIFIALEISSISTYILAGFRRRLPSAARLRSNISCLGRSRPRFFFIGIALMFGPPIDQHQRHQPGAAFRQHSCAAYAGIALMFVGLGFKVAAAPFHIWTPDVYEGAPSPVVWIHVHGAQSRGICGAAANYVSSQCSGAPLAHLVTAALSMTLGNVGALVQDNVKRLLAYSSIAHAGYLLVAFAALPAAAFPPRCSMRLLTRDECGSLRVVSHLPAQGTLRYTRGLFRLGRRSPLLAAHTDHFFCSR